MDHSKKYGACGRMEGRDDEMTFDRIIVIVLDSVGIGELPDAAKFGDQGAHTLGHIAERVKHFSLPNLQRLGLGNITPLERVKEVDRPHGFYGKMAEASVGKDTMTGHWELMGLKVSSAFQTYPNGFPQPLIEQFIQETGRDVIGNKPASGTEIIEELGKKHLETGAWIVYTSADSVLQIAAHEDVIPLDELYRGCEIARQLTMKPEFSVGRVIARPFIGRLGAFERTANRHDYAVKPPEPTVLNSLQDAGIKSLAIGKINDIFSGEGITEAQTTKNNEEGIARTISAIRETKEQGLIFTNLVDFDSKYGHRRNPEGYAEALMQFDQCLPDLQAVCSKHDLLILTADHGNDPTHHGTDHTREYVPLIVWSPQLTTGGSLGVRATFADVAATIADNFKLTPPTYGASFLKELKSKL